MKIAIEKIIVSKDNPRQSFDEEGLRRLGESIKTHGQLQAILLRPKGSGYELVVGERRLRASKLIGLTEIDATVQDLDDSRCMLFRLIENAQREDLTDAEKGNTIAVMLSKFSDEFPTIEAVASEVNKSADTINMWLYKSDKLSETVKKFVARKELSDHSVQDLLKFNHEIQDKLASAIIKYKIKGNLHRDFIKRYDLSSEKYPTLESLEELANEVKGIKTVKVDLAKLSPKARAEVERKLADAKKEATALRREHTPRVNHRQQGRPRKNKKKEPANENEPVPKLTFPIAQVKVVSVAVNFPESLWETVLRYTETTDKPMLVEEAVISLLESHPLLKGL